MFTPADTLSPGHEAARRRLSGEPGYKILRHESTAIAHSLRDCRIVAGRIFHSLALSDGARNRARDLFDRLTEAHLVFVTKIGPEVLMDQDKSKKVYESLCNITSKRTWSLAKALGAPMRVGGFVASRMELDDCRKILEILLETNSTYQRPDIRWYHATLASFLVQEQAEGPANKPHTTTDESEKIREELLSLDRAVDEARSKMIVLADQLDPGPTAFEDGFELHEKFSTALDNFMEARYKVGVMLAIDDDGGVVSCVDVFVPPRESSPVQSAAADADKSRELIPVQQGIPFSLSVSTIVQELFSSQHASLCQSEDMSTNYADDMALVPETVMLAIEVFSDACVRHQQQISQQTP
jgi:hypothetical protein